VAYTAGRSVSRQAAAAVTVSAAAGGAAVPACAAVYPNG